MSSRARVFIWTASLLLAIAFAIPAANALAESRGEPAPSGAHEEEAFDPSSEFNLHPYVELKIGPLDMSITKAVIYLWLSGFICCAWGVWQARRMSLKPDKKQTFTELIYEFAHDQIAKATLSSKVFITYMPYVAALFLFIWVNNVISFIPLPFGHESALGPIPDLGLYAATSNINVTLALTLMTIGLTHYLGIKHNGFVGYFASWAPPGSIGLKLFMWPIHALSEVVRIISLSVRLFANMLVGHLLIIVVLGLVVILGNAALAFITVPAAWAVYMFEVGLVATLQAFIFAILSGVYMGGATESAH